MPDVKLFDSEIPPSEADVQVIAGGAPVDSLYMSAVDGITIAGNGTAEHPLHAIGGGFTGAQGAAGAQGGAGAQGAQGVHGAQGNTGGAQGAAGAAGAQGGAGAQGNTGGAQGASGAQGAAGSSGSGGAQGAAGAQGNTGGAQGAAGTNGTNGTNGAQGAAGAQGAQGIPGNATPVSLLHQSNFTMVVQTVNQLDGSFVVVATLPSAATAGSGTWTILKVTPTPSTPSTGCKVQPGGGDTIDSGGAVNLTVGGESLIFVSNGVSNWEIVATYLQAAISQTLIDLADGTGVGLSPAGVVRLRQVAGVLQLSYNGGAYVNVVTS